MPFETFRRNQRPLLAVFGLMAMFAFVVSDSLMNFLGSRTTGINNDETVATLYGEEIKASNLGELANQRAFANDYFSKLLSLKLSAAQIGLPVVQNFFGPTDDRSLVDALILQKEADKLGIPIDHDATRRWLREAPVTILLQSFGLSGSEVTMRTFRDRIGNITDSDLDATYQAFFENRIPDQSLLDAIGNQLRLIQVQRLGISTEVSPLDVFEEYRKEAEAVSVNAVAFPVDAYLTMVGEPTEDELKTLYEKGKNTEPSRTIVEPAFKIPRRVQVEAISADSNAVIAKLTAEMNDERVKEEYESRKDSDFTLPPLTEEERIKLSPLPQDVFASDPDAKLTPKGLSDSQVPPAPPEGTRYRPIDEVRTSIVEELAREDAAELIDAKFASIRDQVMDPFADKILAIEEENEVAREEGLPGNKPLPQYSSDALVEAVKKLELTYEKTNLISFEEATASDAVLALGAIVDARLGTEIGELGDNFTTAIFSDTFKSFDPNPFTTIAGRRYLIWKVDDQPARVPDFQEIKANVVDYWKMTQARTLAEKDAKAFLEAASKKDGDLISVANELKKPLIVTAPTTRMSTSFSGMPARENQFPELVEAGQTLMNQAFTLQVKQLIVQPNATSSVYYVLGLNSRRSVTPEELYGPTGPFMRLVGSAISDAANESRDNWMNELRKKAGLPADWKAPSERDDKSKTKS